MAVGTAVLLGICDDLCVNGASRSCAAEVAFAVEVLLSAVVVVGACVDDAAVMRSVDEVELNSPGIRDVLHAGVEDVVVVTVVDIVAVVAVEAVVDGVANPPFICSKGA